MVRPGPPSRLSTCTAQRAAQAGIQAISPALTAITFGKDRPGRTIPLPGRSQAYEGAFSPDGRLLALLVTARTGAGGRAVAVRLAVAAVASGRLTAVPGTTVGSGNGVDLGWQAGSGQLVADVSLQNSWQVAVWRPGDTHLSVAVTRVPADSWPVVGPGPYCRDGDDHR